MMNVNCALVKDVSVYLLLSFLVRSCTRAAPLNQFLQTLSSILKHREMALNLYKRAEWLALHPQPLSCTEALALLLRWASMSRNTTLVRQIQALSEKHKVKELLGEWS